MRFSFYPTICVCLPLILRCLPSHQSKAKVTRSSVTVNALSSWWCNDGYLWRYISPRRHGQLKYGERLKLENCLSAVHFYWSQTPSVSPYWWYFFIDWCMWNWGSLPNCECFLYHSVSYSSKCCQCVTISLAIYENTHFYFTPTNRQNSWKLKILAFSGGILEPLGILSMAK